MIRLNILLRYYISKYIYFCHLGVMALVKISPLQAAEDLSRSATQNVSFEEVLQLPFRSSDHRISYGQELTQFGSLWLPEENNNGTVIFIHGGCWMNEYE